MIISVDFDNTYTNDPVTFNKVIKIFQDAGHTVVCVTFRTPAMGADVLRTIGSLIGKDNCFFSSGELKKPFMEAQGIEVDIWIDDMPEIIARNRIVTLGGWGQD